MSREQGNARGSGRETAQVIAVDFVPFVGRKDFDDDIEFVGIFSEHFVFTKL